MNSKREEYKRFLEWGDFKTNTQPDPLAVLGVTEGRRNTDYFEVFPSPIQNAAGEYQFRFFLHGIEWLAEESKTRVSTLKKKERLLCMFDAQNSYDPDAVALRTEDDRKIVGYLPRYINKDFSEIFNKCDSETLYFKVVRANNDAPLQFKVLCQLNACWPTNYKPFSSDDFLPIKN